MAIKVVIFGASGMVGEGVLHEALNHAMVGSVLVVGRRSCAVSHPKLTELIHSDFFDYSAIKDQLTGFDACLFCLGVSSIGMSEPDYTHITYDLTMQAAEVLSQCNPGMTFCYVSGSGTDKNGRSMWARVKGKTENDLRKFPFKAAYAFRPGYMKPTKGLKNAFLAAKMLALFYPVLRLLFSKYVTTLAELGLAMIHASVYGSDKPVLECVDILKLAHRVQRGN